MSNARPPCQHGVRLLLLILLMPLLQFAAAAPGDESSVEPKESQPVTPSSVAVKPLPHGGPRTVAELLAAFDLAYLAPDFERESYFAAEAALKVAEQLLQPRATFKESLDWDDYSALALEFGLDLVVPLHSSVAGLQSQLATLDLESRRLALDAAKADATASLLVEIANLAALGWARALVADALITFQKSARSWHDDSLANSGYVPPEERPAFEQYLKLRDAAAWFAEQHAAGERRLSRSLDLTGQGPFVPPLFAVEEYLAGVATPLPAVPACLATSVNGKQAQLRSRSRAIDDSLRSRSEFSIILTADLGYAFPSWSTSGRGGSPTGSRTGSRTGSPTTLPLPAGRVDALGGLDAALALEARILVPDGWPLAGNAALSVAPEHSRQSLELSWPPLPTPEVVVSDRLEDLGDELQDLEAELVARRSAWSQAVDDRELLERRLSWAIIDTAPYLTAEGVGSRLQEAIQQPNLYLIEPPGGGPSQGPEAAVAAVELRVQHAFARVAEISARAHYLAACGRL